MSPAAHFDAGAVEMRALLDHYGTLSAAAFRALLHEDADGLRAALDGRQAVIERIDPLLEQLLRARATLTTRGASEDDAEHARCTIDAVLVSAGRAMAGDARLTAALGAERQRLARALGGVPRAAGAYAGLSSATAALPRVDLRR